ncbi:MAG: hypothetical protein ABIP03_14325 [Aquihabitans sp.]
MKRQQRSIGWVDGAAPRAELTARLGVEWRHHDGMVQDLACVPPAMPDGFSKRILQVKARYAEFIRR